jgi:hypothetical protein
MGRPHIEFIQSLGVEREPIDEGPFAGAEQRLLSADDGDGSYSALVHFPAGWSGDLSGRPRPTELFVVNGRLDLNGKGVGEGVYAFVPPGAHDASVRAAGETTAMVMVDPEEEAGGEIEVVDSNGMKFMSSNSESIPAGIVVKRLRTHPRSGDMTWVAAVVPGWKEHRAEIHDTVEECLMLRGDILLGHRGVMEPGSYFWRPANVEHGPMFSLNGGVFFFRSKGGNLRTTHVAVPGWEQMVEDYAAREPYFTGSL